jgi:hypothetical protein
MAELKLPMSGGCRCGRVRIEITAPPLITMACHCTGCQRMSASAFSLSAAIPTEGFRITKGETAIGGLRGAGGHHFCPHCMTWMFTRPEGLDFFVNLRPTMLDDASWYVPFVETYTSEKLPWASVPARHSYPRFPPVEDFEGLMQAFAADG